MQERSAEQQQAAAAALQQSSSQVAELTRKLETQQVAAH